MRVGSVKIYTTTSNGTIKLSYSNPLVLYNIKILAINPIMNLTITVTSANGDKWSFTIQSAAEISFKKINYQSITFQDSNNYTIYYTLQAIYADCYQELLELEQESDVSINSISYAPKGSIIFTTSQNWVVPVGVYKIKVITIGGGGGGGGGYSSTYVGGGGGSGAINYTEIFVTPGEVIQIYVGAGGTGGTGGSSPTGGGSGGATWINLPNPITGNYETVAWAGGGGGGGAASSTANGSAGSGGPPAGYIPYPIYVTAALVGNAGSGQIGGATPIFSPTFGNSGVVYNSPNYPLYPTFGTGGNGGNVNGNGANGQNGVVIIWWGD